MRPLRNFVALLVVAAICLFAVPSAEASHGLFNGRLKGGASRVGGAVKGAVGKVGDAVKGVGRFILRR